MCDFWMYFVNLGVLIRQGDNNRMITSMELNIEHLSLQIGLTGFISKCSQVII